MTVKSSRLPAASGDIQCSSGDHCNETDTIQSQTLNKYQRPGLNSRPLFHSDESLVAHHAAEVTKLQRQKAPDDANCKQQHVRERSLKWPVSKQTATKTTGREPQKCPL